MCRNQCLKVPPTFGIQHSYGSSMRTPSPDTAIAWAQVLTQLETLTTRLHACITTESLFQAGVNLARAHLNLDGVGCLALTGSARGSIVAAAGDGDRPDPVPHTMEGGDWDIDGLIAAARTEGGWAIAAVDCLEDDRQSSAGWAHLGGKALLISPIWVADNGSDSPQLWDLVIGQQSQEARAWNDWERGLLQHIATQLGRVLERLTLQQQLADCRREESRWRAALEGAVVCGDDLAIQTLAQNLPPACASLARYLHSLATNYQFEQILQLLPTLTPP